VKTSWPSRFHVFLLASGLLIGVAVLASGTLVGRLFERQLLAHEEEYTAKVIQTQARQHLAPADFVLLDPGREHSTFAAFLRELPEVFRVKLFDREGRIVWSDEPRLIGLAFPDNPYLARALRGEVATVLEAPVQPEHAYERGRAYVAEAYVPIRLSGGPELVGVIETYKDATPLVLGIRRTRRLIWGMAGGTGVLVYVALALVVWQASRNEQRAIRRLEAIVTGIADRMVIADRDMRVVWLNGAAADSLDPGTNALGRPCFEIFGAETQACDGCPVVRTFRSGEVERGVRARRLPDGTVQYLDLVAAPLRDGSGQVHQALEVARDITELVQMDERLTRSHLDLLAKTEELERANRALKKAQAQLVGSERLAAVGEVVVGLHHAVLNPLAGILGTLQVLRDGALAPAARAVALDQAEAEVRKIEQLIRRLPALQHAAGTPYVGKTTMLDLDPARAAEE
jgi:PAS domain-containing protein